MEAIREHSIEQPVVRPIGEVLRFSDTPGYEWSRPTHPGVKTAFNLVACDNEFETEFAAFLDRCSDTVAYAKNNLFTHFSLDYQSSEGNIRYYYPDFIVRLVSGQTWLIETKGVEDVEVERKDARAKRWCKDVTSLTGAAWSYAKVPYSVFERSSAVAFGEMIGEIGAKES